MGLDFPVMIGARMCYTLKNTLICILQVVLAHQRYVDDLSSSLTPLQEVAPGSQCRCWTDSRPHLSENDGVEALPLHVYRHLVDRGQVLTLNDGLGIDIAEMCHLLPQLVAQFMLRAQHQHVRLNTQPLQQLHTGLRGLGLQLACCCQIGHVCQVNVQRPLRTQFPAQLANGFKKGLTLYVANGAANFGYDEIKRLLGCIEQNSTLYLVSNMRNHLNGLTQIVAPPLTLYDAQIDAPRGDTIVAGGLYARETLVVTQVKVGLHAVGCHIAFTMLIGVQCPRVDIDVGVELLNGYPVATRLQQFSKRR